MKVEVKDIYAKDGKNLLSLTMDAEDMFQCEEAPCHQGYPLKDCKLVVEYKPENHSPPQSARIECPNGHWVMYSNLYSLTIDVPSRKPKGAARPT